MKGYEHPLQRNYPIDLKDRPLTNLYSLSLTTSRWYHRLGSKLLLQELLKTGFPLRGSMWGKPRSEQGGGGCRRIKHRSQGSGVEGCEGGAERNWGNEVSSFVEDGGFRHQPCSQRDPTSEGTYYLHCAQWSVCCQSIKRRDIQQKTRVVAGSF